MSWSIFHVHHSLCSSSWITKRTLPFFSPLLSSPLLSSLLLLLFSLFLEEWQTWAFLPARHLRTVLQVCQCHFRDYATVRQLWEYSLVTCPNLKLLFLLFCCLIYLSSLCGFFPPSFHFPPSNILLASVMHQALCLGLRIKAGEKKRP